jgi:hypothetical protein
MDSGHRAALISSHSSSLSFYQQSDVCRDVGYRLVSSSSVTVGMATVGASMVRQAPRFVGLTNQMVLPRKFPLSRLRSRQRVINLIFGSSLSASILEREQQPSAQGSREATACAPNQQMPAEILPLAPAHMPAASVLSRRVCLQCLQKEMTRHN